MLFCIFKTTSECFIFGIPDDVEHVNAKQNACVLNFPTVSRLRGFYFDGKSFPMMSVMYADSCKVKKDFA